MRNNDDRLFKLEQEKITTQYQIYNSIAEDNNLFNAAIEILNKVEKLHGDDSSDIDIDGRMKNDTILMLNNFHTEEYKNMIFDIYLSFILKDKVVTPDEKVEVQSLVESISLDGTKEKYPFIYQEGETVLGFNLKYTIKKYWLISTLIVLATLGFAGYKAVEYYDEYRQYKVVSEQTDAKERAVKLESQEETRSNSPETKQITTTKGDSAILNSWYIQVGSFTHGPNKDFLEDIKENRFAYVLKGGKVLLGPFENEEAAKSELLRAKASVHRDAFVKYLAEEESQKLASEIQQQTELEQNNQKTEEESANNNQCSSHIVTVAQLNIRDNPGKPSNILGKVNKGDKVCIYSFSGKWGETENGWVSRKYLRPEENRRENLHSDHAASNNNNMAPSIATISRQEVMDFINLYISQTNNGNLNEITSLYAQRVNYFQSGEVSRNFVYKDKKAYIKRWPNIQQDFIELINIKDITGQSTGKEVRYSIRFDVYNQSKKKGIKGKAINTIVLKKENDKLEIISDRQKVLTREKY